ncbi:MAG: hypothetical protein IKF01_01610 [Bacilli bacterium]|nr:hypothetical protein [Bacilli bacterium]
MKKIQSVLFIIVLIFIGFEILTESESILSSVKFSLNIFKENIFPSLFPFFILSSLLVNYGFVELISNLFKKPMNKIFKINSKCAFIFFMSIISGNPSNAKYTKELIDNGSIDKYEATKILCFSSFTNPLFILGTVRVFLNNKEVPLLILIIHYVSNIIVGILIRNYHPSKKEEKTNFKNAVDLMHKKRISNNKGFGTIITNSLTESINTLLLVLGVISVSLVLTTIIDNNLSLNSTVQSLLNGFIEMTQGLKYVSLEAIPLRLKSILTVMILSFGGLSVHLQTMSILSDTDVKYLPFLFSRILASLISGIMMLLFFEVWISI